MSDSTLIESSSKSMFAMDCVPPSTKSLFNDPEMLEGRMTKTMTVIILIVAIFTVSINLGVIIRVLKLYKKDRDIKPAFFFIGNLAVSDFLIGLYIIIIFCIDLTQLSSEWRDSCCGFLTAFVVTACEETICNITLIAIDKYIFICHGISYRIIVTKKRVGASIILTWLFSLLLGFLPAIGMHEQDWCACNFTLFINKGFSVLLFITAVVIPLAVIVTLYSIILSLAIKVTRRRMDKSKSKGTTRSSRLTFTSKSSNKTSSTKLSTTGTSMSSFQKNTTYSTTNKKEVANEVRRSSNLVINNDRKLNDSNPITTSIDTTSTLITTDLMPYEIESEDESDSNDSSEINAIYRVPAGDIRVTSKKSRSYDLQDISTIADQDQLQCTQITVKLFTEDDNTNKSISNDVIISNLKDHNIQTQEDTTDNEEEHSLTSNTESNSIATNPKTENEINLRRKLSYFKKVVSETKDKVQFLQKCRAIKPILLILFCFAITYVPFVTGILAFKVQHEKSLQLFKALNNLLYLSVVLNSLMNPFVYAYGYKEFRIRTKNFKGICAKEKRNRRRS